MSNRELRSGSYLNASVRALGGVGDVATGELLRRHLKTLEADAGVLDRYLADDTLVRRDATG